MSVALMLTQAVLLFYGTRLFPLLGRLDETRFFCYAVIIFFGCLALRKVKLRKILFLDLVACGILAFAFLSYVYSINPKLTLLRSTGNLLMYLAIFWALWITCRTPKDAYKLIQALIFVWFFYYLINIVFLFVRPEDSFMLMSERTYVSEPYKRFSGITGNPNNIGDFSAIILPLVFWDFQRKKNILNLFLLSAVAFSFFYSFSRNAFVCGLIGLSVYLYLSTRRHSTLLIVCTIFLIALMLLYVDLFGLFLPTVLVRPESILILGGRLEGWQAAIELIKKHPFRGYGFGVEDLIFKYFDYDFQVHAGASVHNSFLGLAIQLGWIAAAIFYFTLVGFLIRSLHQTSQLKSKSRLFVIALYASVLSGFLTSLLESWIYSAGGVFAFPFFVFVMLLMKMLEFNRNPLRETVVETQTQ